MEKLGRKNYSFLFLSLKLFLSILFIGSFENWLMVGKESLNWNENCIHMFWQMLLQAVYYTDRDRTFESNISHILVEIEYITIFLLLHVLSDEPNEKNNLSATYDSIWPSSNLSDTEVVPLSPSSSPTKDQMKSYKKSPLSPKSPKSPMPSSPTKSSMTGSRTPRSTAQHLHSVRKKMPSILKLLALDFDDNAEMTDVVGEGQDSDISYGDVMINKKIVDALGLIIRGGFTREEMVRTSIF